MEQGSTHQLPDSGYQVKFVGDSTDPDDGAGSFAYEISWGEREPDYRVVASDAGISIQGLDETWLKIYREKGWHRKIWDYSDVMRAVHFALGEALEEQRRRCVLGSMAFQSQEKIEEWIASTCPGAKPLDVGRDETRDFILSCDWRKGSDYGVDVLYKGRWLHLGQTDLCDDIRTSVSWSSDGDPHHINYWRSRVNGCFGARLSDDSFSIVDSISDG